MKKLLLILCITMLSSIFVTAQTADDFHKGEFSASFSNNQVDTGISDDNEDLRDFFRDREGFNGVEVSGVGNLNRYVGLKGDFSVHVKDFDFDVPRVGTTPATRFEVDASLYNFLGGVQVKDNSKEGSRFRPFGHALVGAAHRRTKLDNEFFTSAFCQQVSVNCREDFSESETGFAAAIGGGLDIKATERFSIRAFQVDYNPTRFGGSTQNNFRFGVGIVIH
jgi:opacity protein-like surface antigen